MISNWCMIIPIEQFKVSIITYCAQFTQQPPYLAYLLCFSDMIRQLRSIVLQRFAPETKLNVGKVAFSVAAPKIRKDTIRGNRLRNSLS